ncbi:MAG: hypothetical protein ACI4FN_04455 [Acutalibacteraceae bacterium]
MLFILRIMTYYSEIALLFCMGVTIYSLKKFFIAIKHKYDHPFKELTDSVSDSFSDIATKWTIPLLIISFFATLISNNVVQELVGIDDIRLKSDGVYSYYVEISNDKYSYTLPAQIRIDTETDDSDSDRGITKTYNHYTVEKVYFTNGGYLDFDFDYITDIKETSYGIDQKGDYWECTILNKHAYSPYIKETSAFNFINIFLLILEIVTIGFVTLTLIINQKHAD